MPWDKANALLAHIESGHTLTSWCDVDGNPHISTIYLWREKDSEFDRRFARAREIQGQTLVERAQDIANHAAEDWVVTDDGKTRLNTEHIQRSKLRVETMLKRAACFCPSLFGTRVQMEGVKGGEAIKVERSGPPEPAVTDLASEIQQLGQLVAQHLPK